MRNKKLSLGVSILLVFLSTVFAGDAGSFELKLQAPITTWDEAIPLGNGMLGGLLWGSSYLSIPHNKSLNCNKALTLEAWIKPKNLGGRIIDKCVAGTTQGYDMDTYSGSVRLISNANTSNPMSRQKLKLNQWIHIAGTIDGKTGDTKIYINGKKAEIQ